VSCLLLIIAWDLLGRPVGACRCLPSSPLPPRRPLLASLSLPAPLRVEATWYVDLRCLRAGDPGAQLAL